MMSFTFSACNEDCCMSGVNKVCGVDEPECAGYATWEECQTYLSGLNYSCE